MELDLGTWLEVCWAQLDAREFHVIVAHRVEVEGDGAVGVVVVVGAAVHLHNDLGCTKREALEDNLTNQRLPANKDAQTLVIEFKLGVEGVIAFIVGLRRVLQYNLSENRQQGAQKTAFKVMQFH